MKVQAVPFPIHPPNQHISVNHQPGCVQPHWSLTVQMQCNHSVVLELSPLSIRTCSIGPKPIKSWINQNITEESFPCKGSVLFIPSYLQSAWFLKQDYVLPLCRLHRLPELPQQHLTSPSHKELWKRSSSSHINLIPLLVSKAQGHRVQWHIECSQEQSLPGCAHTGAVPWNQGAGKGLPIGIFPVSSSKQYGIPFWGRLFRVHEHRTSFFQPHTLTAWDGITGGNHTLEAHCWPVQHLPKGILGSKVRWSRQVTSHLQHWINRISHKLVQLPLNSSVLPTWQQPVLIYSCADSDPSPPFEAAQGMPGLSAAHSFPEFSWLPLL